MKKICIVAEDMKVAGVQVSLAALLNNIDYSRYSVQLYLISKEGELLQQIPEQVEIKEIQFKKKYLKHFVYYKRIDSIKMFLVKVKKAFFLLRYHQDKSGNKYYNKLLNYVKIEEPQCDIAIDFLGYGRFTTAIVAKKMIAEKKAVWFHDEDIQWVKKVEEYLPTFDKMFCVSQSVEKELLTLYPQYKSKIGLFYNPVNAKRVREMANTDLQCSINDNLCIVSVGRLESQKGFDIAIDVAKKLEEKNLDFTWYIAGEGSARKELESKIEKYHLQTKVVLLGMLDNPYPLIKRCDIYVQPSRHEGYGLTVMEARSLAKPIIVTRIPSLCEQIQDNINGFVADLTVESIADKIMEVYCNPSIREKVIDKLLKEEINYMSELSKIYEI